MIKVDLASDSTATVAGSQEKPTLSDFGIKKKSKLNIFQCCKVVIL